MKDINGHYSSSVLVIRVCLFELSFFLLSSRSTVSSPFFFFFFIAYIYIYMLRPLPSLTKECAGLLDKHALIEYKKENNTKRILE